VLSGPTPCARRSGGLTRGALAVARVENGSALGGYGLNEASVASPSTGVVLEKLVHRTRRHVLPEELPPKLICMLLIHRAQSDPIALSVVQPTFD